MTIKHFNFRVHIHMGAHKTASTFIQSWLTKNRHFLRENHIAYIPLQKLRQNFTPAFSALTTDKDKLLPIKTARLRHILFTEAESCGFDLAATRLLIISEENLLGSMSTLHTKGVLYPALKGRMRVLARIFADYETQPFLALRNYSEFYPSAYAETFRKGFIKPFEQYMEGLDLAGNSWPVVIEKVESALGPTRLWPYEQFQDNAHVVLSELLQTPIGADRVDVDTIIRKSLTQKGLDVAMRCRNILSAAEMKELINLLAEKMRFEAPDDKISIRDNKTVVNLDNKYTNDLQQLASRLIIAGAGL